MKYRYQKPNPLLTKYIQTVLVMEGFSNSENPNLPLFTNGMPALLCRTENNRKARITIFGQSIPSEKMEINDNATLVAFFFKPYALGTIFKLAARELKNTSIELNLWNPQKTMALNLQLLHSGSTKEKVDILSNFVLDQFRTNQKECEIIQFATDQIMQNPNAEVLEQILKKLNITERTFQRIFKKYVGVTPNHYRRICQFYFGFSQLQGRHFDKLTDVAYTNGYFDQSHYIRSFKEFTDTTPNEYLQFGLGKKNN